MTSDQVHGAFKRAIGGGRVQSSASRVKARRELCAAKVAVLREAIVAIRRLTRETPAWAHGYNSAVTAIEIQIADIEAAA